MKFALTSDLHYGFLGNTQSKIVKFFKKLVKENINYLIIAGDIATTKPRQIKRCLEIAREYLDCDIGVVFGNHDFWGQVDKKHKKFDLHTLKEFFKFHEDICEELGIERLNHIPSKFLTSNKKISIFGFDGWYNTANPSTNDIYNIPKFIDGCPSMVYLNNKAWKDFDKCLEEAKKDDGDVKILVTHHNLYKEGSEAFSGIQRFYPEVKENFDILCCGHTHLYRNYTDGRLRILNCGSDYNNPKYIIFDI